eukprot:scaffold106501_cov30-Tisochrysis_lutea.AAC.4
MHWRRGGERTASSRAAGRKRTAKSQSPPCCIGTLRAIDPLASCWIGRACRYRLCARDPQARATTWWSQTRGRTPCAAPPPRGIAIRQPPLRLGFGKCLDGSRRAW